MFNRIRLIVIAVALFAAPALVTAQTADPKELLRAAISLQLRGLLGDNAAGVVTRLKGVKPDGAISRNFNAAAVSKAVFGRSAANVAPDCSSTQTPSKEPDQGRCVMQVGTPDAPTGAYSMLSFSKNVGIGDITFMRRPAFDPNATTLPKPVKLTNAEAYAGALKFLDLLGVPRSEIPLPPQNAKNPLPVRSLLIGVEQDPGKDASRVEVQKVINFQRAFVVPGGLFKDPASGIELNHVLAPGEVTVAIDDGGVQLADLQGWSDAQMDSKLDPALAKTTPELVNEITDDLYAEGVRKAGGLSILIALRKAYPNPDDPNPPLCPVCGVLRPALRVVISQVGPGVTESSERNFIAPGVVREYDLVGQTAAEFPAR
jgi:hypothetical protein